MHMVRSILLALVIMAPAPSAQAFPEDLPEIASASFGNGGWVRYELFAEEGAAIGYRLDGSATDIDSFAVASWIIRGSGRLTTLFHGSTSRGARVSTLPTGTIVETGSGRPASNTFSSWATIRGMLRGSVTVVVGAVAKGGSLLADVELTGVGISLLGSSTGYGTFHREADDFDAAVHARGGSRQIEAAAGAQASVVSDAPLYAWFAPDHELAAIRYEGPSRKQSELTMASSGPLILDGEPPGRHDFFVDLATGALFTGWVLVGVPAAAI